MGTFVEYAKKSIEEIGNGNGFNEVDESIGNCIDGIPSWKEMMEDGKLSPEPSKRHEHEKELEEIDSDVCRLVAMEHAIQDIILAARERVGEIARRFSTEYDKDMVVKAANWYFRNVSHAKDECGQLPSEEECAKDGITYIAKCLQSALGEQQLFRIVDVRYEAGNEGMYVSFTIPECLGVWELHMPFATVWKPSLKDYVGRRGEDSPFPLQVRICYRSPRSDCFVKTIMSAWSFHDLSRKWFMLDMDAHRKSQYLPTSVSENGRVIDECYDRRIGKYEMESDLTVDEWMRNMREWHSRMLPEWSK